MKTILVTGATGNIGRQVVAQLLDKEIPVRALVRDPNSANLPANVELVRGDLTSPSSLDEPLRGVDTVFLLWQASPDSVEATLACMTERVKRVVFLSAPHQTPHPFFQQPNAIAPIHREIERRIMASGVQWAFLRPGMLMSNARLWWSSRIRAGANVIRWPYADVPTAPIDERDIAAVAVRMLFEDSQVGTDPVITGPESLTHADQVRIIGEVIGRPLRLQEITPDEARHELLSVIPIPPIIDLLLNAWGAGAGHAAYMASKVEEITGRPTRTFRDWVAGHASDFR